MSRKPRIPSRAQRLHEARAQLLLRQRFERQLAADLQREFRRAIRSAANAYPAWRATMGVHKTQLRQILRANLRRSALAMGHRARQQFRKSGTPLERKLYTEDELDRRLLDLAEERADDLYADIWGTTGTRIENSISRGIEAEDSPAEIASRMVDEVDGMSSSRAMTIARTETAVAMNSAQNEEMQAVEDDLGLVVLKVWTATEDDRTRDTHRDADGQAAKMDEAFTVGGAEMDFPSDPSGPLEEVINCRCVAVYSAY